MKFKKDYAKSKKAEDAFQDLLHQHFEIYSENSQEKGYFPYWDISTTSTTTNHITTYEVKFNECYDSETICIEYDRMIGEKKQSTGLGLSKADYYVFSFGCDSNFYLISTEKLKKLILEPNPNKEFTIDANGFCLYFFRKAYLLSLCMKL